MQCHHASLEWLKLKTGWPYGVLVRNNGNSHSLLRGMQYGAAIGKATWRFLVKQTYDYHVTIPCLGFASSFQIKTYPWKTSEWMFTSASFIITPNCKQPQIGALTNDLWHSNYQYYTATKWNELFIDTPENTDESQKCAWRRNGSIYVMFSKTTYSDRKRIYGCLRLGCGLEGHKGSFWNDAHIYILIVVGFNLMYTFVPTHHPYASHECIWLYVTFIRRGGGGGPSSDEWTFRTGEPVRDSTRFWERPGGWWTESNSAPHLPQCCTKMAAES